MPRGQPGTGELVFVECRARGGGTLKLEYRLPLRVGWDSLSEFKTEVDRFFMALKDAQNHMIVQARHEPDTDR